VVHLWFSYGWLELFGFWLDHLYTLDAGAKVCAEASHTCGMMREKKKPGTPQRRSSMQQVATASETTCHEISELKNCTRTTTVNLFSFLFLLV
jgi:hypothetical protein